MKYLTKVVETYRLANEKEVEDFLQELKMIHDLLLQNIAVQKKKRNKKAKLLMNGFALK